MTRKPTKGKMTQSDCHMFRKDHNILQKQTNKQNPGMTIVAA